MAMVKSFYLIVESFVYTKKGENEHVDMYDSVDN